MKDYIHSVLPFAQGVTEKSNEETLKRLEKEVARGPISFTAMDSKVVKGAIRRVGVSEEMKKALEATKANKKKE